MPRYSVVVSRSALLVASFVVVAFELGFAWYLEFRHFSCPILSLALLSFGSVAVAVVEGPVRVQQVVANYLRRLIQISPCVFCVCLLHSQQTHLRRADCPVMLKEYQVG